MEHRLIFNYFLFRRYALRILKIDAISFFVLQYIATFKHCYCSYQTMADEMHISRRNLIRVCKALSTPNEKGEALLIIKSSPATNHFSINYHLLMRHYDEFIQDINREETSIDS